MSSLEKCLIKESRLRALFQRQGEKRKFKERAFRTNDVDDLLSQGVTFQALCDLLGQKNHPVVWMGEDAFIRSPHQYQARHLETAPQGFRRLLDLRLNNDNYWIEVYGRESSTASYTSLLNLLLHLIALDGTIRQVDLSCTSYSNPSGRPVLTVPPSALGRFLSNAQSPRAVNFVNFSLSEDQCRVLFFQCNPNVLLSRIDLGLLHDRGQSLFDALASNHRSQASLSIGGLTSLSDELFRAFVLGLRGNSTLKYLDLQGCFNNEISPQRMSLFLEALAGNLGLETLVLSHHHRSLSDDDNNWDALWDDVSHHPCIKCVYAWGGTLTIHLSQEQKVRRTQSIVRALVTNIHLSTIDVGSGTIVDDELMENSVQPTLEVNLFRPRIQAIFQEPDQSLRWKILGRALQHHRVQNNQTIRYLLLSKNADLFQSHAPTQADRLAIRGNGVVDRQSLLDEERSALEEEIREARMTIPPSSSRPRHHHPVDDDQQSSRCKRQRRS